MGRPDKVKQTQTDHTHDKKTTDTISHTCMFTHSQSQPITYASMPENTNDAECSRTKVGA
jgi:hypothetical protein